MNDDILYYVNQHRAAMGLSKLQSFDAATVQAYNHSKNMATGRTPFGHTGFEGRVNAIAKTEGRMSASAENVAYGELTAREVVQGWLKSPGHKKNTEGNYALTGIGTYTDNRGIIFFHRYSCGDKIWLGLISASTLIRTNVCFYDGKPGCWRRPPRWGGHPGSGG